ncbi:MAG: NAD-dependent epimerase/dehydratase family protein [Bacteroidota bacterium]
MKALVTGANGFIGSHLVELLRKRNCAVRCLVRRTSDTRWLKGIEVEYVYGDLFDEAALRTAVTGTDLVFHSAGLTKAKTREGYYRANTEGTRNLLRACRTHNPGLKRFVQISSLAAAGPATGDVPVTEEMPPRPITTYGKSKLEAERECLALSRDLPVTILRPPAVYGPRDKDVFEFFHTVSRGLQPMVGFGKKEVSLIHVADLVRGFLTAAEHPAAAGGTYFITSPRAYSWEEIGNVTRAVLRKRALRIRIPVFGVYTIAAVAELLALFSSKPALINFEKARDMVQDRWTCNPARAERELGFRAEIGLGEGIQNTVAWCREQGWL